MRYLPVLLLAVVQEDWTAFYALCVQSKQTSFTYYLLEHAWLFPK